MKNKRWQTIAFLFTCGAIVVFFLLAPEGTTPRMPRDAEHSGRSKDFSACFSCHPPQSLPDDHTVDGQAPPVGRSKCYFCHKLEEESAS